jgi:FKBP-type peptidyl-prolyl cis-trans isomerase
MENVMKKILAAAMAAIGVAATATAADNPYVATQKAFLAENLKKPDWKATPSGLQYHPLKKAAATAAQPAKGAMVTVHYEGKFIDGRVFDSSYARKEPATFPLGGVIVGWQEGVPMMRVGEIWEFAIPSDLAYGDMGRPPQIPGGSTLLFKVELLDIAK